MSSGTVSPEVRLVGDVARHFRHLPVERAGEDVAKHLRSFWDPRMLRSLYAAVDSGAVVDPIVLRAAQVLRHNG